VANAPSNGITLIIDDARHETTADADGSFAFTVGLLKPSYPELAFDFLPRDTLAVYLVPGQPLTLRCDASDLLGTIRFSGTTQHENESFVALQQRYDGIDYRALFNRGPDDFLRELGHHQQGLEELLHGATDTHPQLDPAFLRFEQARITYFGAMLRVMRMGLTGNWQEYAAQLDLNNPGLLCIDTYARFLNLYTKAKATELAASDPALKSSVNLVTEARYAVAVATYTDPVVRSSQLAEILRNQFDVGDDGPFGCKGIDAVMARFAKDCTDPGLCADIDRRYRDCLANRNAPVIRPYKRIGTTSLDAHVFPPDGVAKGERRPAFLYFHGGGWAGGIPEWGYDRCRRSAALGFVAITFEYRLRWRHGTTPLESVADAKSAVRWARVHAAELGIDPERVVVAGFSAGGHLGAATAMIPGYEEEGEGTSVSSKPTALVLISSAIDVAEPGWFSECLAGRADPAALSPAQHIRSGLPPTLILQGVNDELCPVAGAQRFCQRMKAADNSCELFTFDGGHLPTPEVWQAIHPRIDTFLKALVN